MNGQCPCSRIVKRWHTIERFRLRLPAIAAQSVRNKPLIVHCNRSQFEPEMGCDRAESRVGELFRADDITSSVQDAENGVKRSLRA